MMLLIMLFNSKLIIINLNSAGKYVNNYKKVSIACHIKICEFVLLGLSKSNYQSG